jgi:hypothetical protein
MKKWEKIKKFDVLALYRDLRSCSAILNRVLVRGLLSHTEGSSITPITFLNR